MTRAAWLRHSAIWIYLVGLTGTMGHLLWTAFFADDAYQIVYSHPVPVAGPEAIRGRLRERPVAVSEETIYVWREVCQADQQHLVTIRRALVPVDGQPAIPLPMTSGVSRLAGCRGFTAPVQLPANLAPGKYRIETEVEYQSNAIRSTRRMAPPVHVIVRGRAR